MIVALTGCSRLGHVEGRGDVAYVGRWYDPTFDKHWKLTARLDEVVIVFSEGSSLQARAEAIAKEGLVERFGYDARTRVAVYLMPPQTTVQEMTNRLGKYPCIEAAAAAATDQDGYTKYFMPGRIVVQMRDSSGAAQWLDRIAAAGSVVLAEHWTPGLYTISVPTNKDLFQCLRDWYRDPNVLYAEPNYIYAGGSSFVPNDPMLGSQWYLSNSSNPGADIQATDAWDITRGDSSVVIAIIDSGAKLDHEDLSANILPRNGADWDFFCDDGEPCDSDIFPCCPDASPDEEAHSTNAVHGTHVAGLAAAVQNNTVGISGVAPNCRIMPLRVSLQSGSLISRVNAINYAAGRRNEFGGMVINCSWRQNGDITSVRTAIQNAYNAGCVVLFAGGNLDLPQLDFPAAYASTNPWPIAVGGTDEADHRWVVDPTRLGSSYGPGLCVTAPASNLLSTFMTGFIGGSLYASRSGTSGSCPIAAGVCALILSANSSLTNTQVETVLRQSAEDLVGRSSEDVKGWDQYMGYGRVNAYRAVQLASGYPLINVTRRDLASGTSPGNGVAWGDYDNDGDLDLYISNHPGANRLLRNDGAENFTRVTNALLEDTGYGAGVGWADYDNDGDLDLYLVNNGSANRLFRNDGGGTFSDATMGPLGDAGNGSGFAYLDYNRDGRVDIYLANNGSANKLFRNDGCGNWSDATHGSLGDAGNSACVATADYDNDGDTDIYLVNSGTSNRLFRNDAGTFVDATTTPIDVNATSKSAAWGDYDNDGDLDLFLVSGGGNRLFRNDGAPSWTFTDVTTSPLAGNAGQSAVWGDFDNDRDLDLYLSNSGANKLLRNDGGGTFVDVTAGPLGDAGDGRGVACADYDGDGDLDVYANNNGSSNKLFRNHAASGAHWLQVNLRGTDSNASAIGARVRLVVAGTTQIREVEGASGLRSQSSLTVEFGLGSATNVTLLEVTWPNGVIQTVAVGSQTDRLWAVDECAPVPTPIESSMSGWAEGNPDPSFMTLHFAFRLDHKADQFKIRYRVYGTSTWTELLCNQPGTACTFSCSDNYERTQSYSPCEVTRFQWQAMAHNCSGWTAAWAPVTPKQFTAYCLQEP